MTFPPRHPFHSSSTSASSSTSGRSRLVRFVQLLPLLSIYSLLGFVTYVYLFSLVLLHLIINQRLVIKSFVLAICFIILCGGSTISLTSASLMRGGRVGHDLARTADDGIEEEEEEEDNRPLLLSMERYQRERDEGEGEGDDDDLPRPQSHRTGPTPRTEWNERGDNRGQSGRREGMMGIFDALNARASSHGTGHANKQLKSDGSVRFCRKCNLVKPDRSHHCSSCGYCIMKMDHHCPWLGGTCVGHHNYKFFLLFLLYSGALGIFVCATTFNELAIFVSDGPENFNFAPVSWAVIALLGAILGFSLSLFGAYHLCLTLSNRTTIEAMERSPTYTFQTSSPNHLLTRHQSKQLQRRISKVNIYDLGWKRNLQAVFGPDWRYWMLPFGRVSAGDGRSFATNPAKELELERLVAELRGETGA